MTAFFVVTTALQVRDALTILRDVTDGAQANSRTFFAFSRDGGLPDRGLFGKLAPNKIPIWSVWLVVFLSIVLCAVQAVLEET